MRPVKKSLKALDIGNKEEGDEKSAVAQMRQCLLKIGDHINDHLSELCDPEKIKFWRT